MQSSMELENSNSLQLKIITPDKTVFDDNVDHVVLPTVDGQMGIYANHTPLMTRVKDGTIKIHLLDNRLCNLHFDHGLAQIKDNLLTILIHGNVNLKEEGWTEQNNFL